jgi:protein disulfide-isomerase
MKKFIVGFLAAAVIWRADAADSVWLTDLPKAEAQARAEKKLVLMDFTGSDWCPGCIDLRKKVFETKKFQTYAATNLVLVVVDFPDKKPQTAELKKANADLHDKFKVEGFPTLVVLDENGKELGRNEGYEADTPKSFIAALEKMKAGK